MIENQGAKGGIVIDSNPGTTANGNPLFAMSGDGTDDVSILKIQLRTETKHRLMMKNKNKLLLNVIPLILGKHSSCFPVQQRCNSAFGRNF